MNAVLEHEIAKGHALVRLEDGQKVRVENPGVEEALFALKVPPREAKQIANALKQQTLAGFDRFDPRVEIDSAVKPGPNPANVVAGVNDPRRGGDRVDIAKDIKLQSKLQAAGIEGEAAKPFIGLQAGDPSRVGDTQVFQGMSPEQVRDFMETRQIQNRRKRVEAEIKKAQKAGRGYVDAGPGVNEQRRNVEAIRKMQEGNIFAQIRADRAAAKAANEPVNVMGTMVTPTQRPVPGDFTEPRVGYKKVIPGVKRVGNQELLPRPVRPTPGVAQSQPTQESIDDVMKRVGDQGREVFDSIKDYATNPKYQRGRRIGYGVGGGLAALATILNMGTEEEQEQLR